MLYTIPDYYKEFQCTADKCEDTCCAGWQIVIDEQSMARYKKVRGDFRWRMLRSVDWINGVFRQDKEKRCAFLNEQNLCDLYTACGEKSLCKTCRQYPRHIEEFEGVREITLSISCPEVARILMEKTDPVTFLSYEKEGEEEYEDFDPFFFSILEDARKAMIEILQNREMPIRKRVLLVLGMAHDMQGRINRQEMFDCFSVIEKYQGEHAGEFADEYLAGAERGISRKSLEDEQISRRKKGRMAMTREMFDKLYELELLREEWDMLLQESEVILYCGSEQEYRAISDEYTAWEGEHTEAEIHLEQLLVYFLFTYFPGAVYDGELYAKVQMAVYCTWMIHELWMARWMKNEKTLDVEEMTDLVYCFSREVEHSDMNLKHVEKIMEKKWFLREDTKDGIQ